MSLPAVRFVAHKGSKTTVGAIQLACRVKPGVSANREGITAVSEEVVEVCVAARAKEGEANKVVRGIIAEVSTLHVSQYINPSDDHQALSVPKSDVEIVKGLKSREKTVMIRNTNVSGTAEEYVERIKSILQTCTNA